MVCSAPGLHLRFLQWKFCWVKQCHLAQSTAAMQGFVMLRTVSADWWYNNFGVQAHAAAGREQSLFLDGTLYPGLGHVVWPGAPNIRKILVCPASCMQQVASLMKNLAG